MALIAEPESRFTRPTDLCPHPERWTSTDDHSTEVEVSELLAGLVRGLQPELCIETGTAWGQTAQAIGEALQRNGHGRLVTFEPDPERAAFSEARCDGLPVEVNACSSVERVPCQPVDFAFFDSLFPLRVPEFLFYRPEMHAGTIVAFHDSAPGAGGGQFDLGRDLRTEIAVVLAPYLRFIHLPTPRGITIGEVL